MNRLQQSIFGIGLAALLAACSSEQAKQPGTPDSCTADTANDPQNCGSCGTACAVGQACVGGVCAASCSAPRLDCDGLCADPASNSLHCGGCNQACGFGQICQNSACVAGSCPTGTISCSGACVDTQADPANCGNCAVACLQGQTCQSGSCVGSSGTGGSGGSGGTDGNGGSGGAGPNGGTGGSDPSGGSGGSGATAGSAGSGAGMAGAAGSAPVVLPPLVTSAQNAYWNTEGMLTEVDTGSPNVTVNDASESQTWDGFGGSFNELGWSYLTTEAMKEQALRLLFSATDGAAFTWGRIPMGSSDYARTRYSLADTGTDVVPNGDESNRPPADTSLNSFSLARDGEMLIPFIKAAQAVKPDLRFWASPWTPPVWMKTGYKSNSGVDSNQPATRPSYFDGGNMRNDSAILTAFAQYFVRFVEGYRAQGINIEMVAPQNEPNYDQNYPSCIWDGATFATFVGQHLGPAMRNLNVGVMLGTLSNSNSGADPAIGSATLGNATARGFLSAVGVQWGMLDAARLSALNANLPVWATEHKCGNYPWNPSGSPPYNNTQAPNDHAYGVESWGYIRDAIKSARVTMYSAWNMVLDRLGRGNDTTRDWKQNALLVADSGTVTATPAYYVFRHFSQYVMPGASVVGVTGGDAVAFKNPDGSLVAVMFNSGGANANYVVAIGGKSVRFAMPGNGWATVKVTP